MASRVFANRFDSCPAGSFPVRALRIRAVICFQSAIQCRHSNSVAPLLPTKRAKWTCVASSRPYAPHRQPSSPPLHPSRQSVPMQGFQPGAGKMRTHVALAISLGLFVAAPGFAFPQESEPGAAGSAGASLALPPDALIEEITFAGLQRIPANAAKARLSSHSGEKLEAAKISSDLH